MEDGLEKKNHLETSTSPNEKWLVTELRPQQCKQRVGNGFGGLLGGINFRIWGMRKRENVGSRKRSKFWRGEFKWSVKHSGKHV